MNYYLDTEFLEGTQKKRFLGISYGKTKPTIDLISIGIVDENNMEYYAISKDFNLRKAWKDEWIRENVLKPIYDECISGDLKNKITFSKSGMRIIINKFGKTNEQISKEIRRFVYSCEKMPSNFLGSLDEWVEDYILEKYDFNFYTYYGAYDWVVFCWLFGKMIDLPNGFPKYSKDLKHVLDNAQDNANKLKETNINWIYNGDLKKHKNYPKQVNEHNALADARWNKKLHEFLKNIK